MVTRGRARAADLLLRKATCEVLEERRLLAHPTVLSAAFDFETAPHKFVVRFDQNVRASLVPSDLRVDQITTADPDPAPTSLAYDNSTNTATFSFSGILPDGNYRAILAAEDIQNTTGVNLVEDKIVESFFLLTDVNGPNGIPDRMINNADFNRLAANYGQSPRTYSQGDFNYDGAVNGADFNLLASRFGFSLSSAPAAPGELRASTFTDAANITLNWRKAATNETGYRIQRSFDGQTFVNYRDLFPNEYQWVDPEQTLLSWTDLGLPDGTRIWYRVRAFGNGADTAYTPKVAATTMLPYAQITGVEGISPTEVAVDWQDRSENESSFVLRVFSGGSIVRTIENIRPDSTSFIVGGLTEGTSYYFDLHAHNQYTDSITTTSNPTKPWGASLKTYDEVFLEGEGGGGGGGGGATEGAATSDDGTTWWWDDFHSAPHPMELDAFCFGLFDNQSKTLSASGLPGHTSVRLEFFGLHSVDGWAPGDPSEAYFKVRAADSEVMNVRLDPPGYVNATWTPLGANVEFEHTGSSLTLSFAGEGFEIPDNEKWLLEWVKVTLIRPVVHVAALGDAGEPSSPGAFVVSRTGPTTRSLGVKLSYSGTASFRDHNPLALEVSIPAGQSERIVEVVPVNDTLEEGTETRIISIKPDRRYVVGTTPATLMIYDDDGGPVDPNLPVPPPKPGDPPGVPPGPWPSPGPGPDPTPDPTPEPPPVPPPPPPPPEPQVENFVNLVIGGWEGFWGWWGWPYSEDDIATISIWGSTRTGPGIPPTDKSAFISVNDDFDEGNKDAQGNPLPDNKPDAQAGHRIDHAPDAPWDWGWDLAGLWLYTASTDSDPNHTATYSLAFPDTVKIWRASETPNNGLAWVEVTSGQSFDAAETDYYGGWWPGFVVEGMKPSQSLHDVGITATFTKGHSVQDTVRFTVTQTDIDIDSDNDNNSDAPERDDEEDVLEDWYNLDARPGKVILVDDHDADGDGIPDYADGYDLHSLIAHDDSTPNSTFVPVVLELKQPATVDSRLYIGYSASNPADGVPTLSDPFPVPGGSLRLWRRNADQPRNKLTVAQGGDYIAPGFYAASDLGLAPGQSKTFWAEVVRPSTTTGNLPVYVSVDSDGPGPGWFAAHDQIRITGSRIELLGKGYQESEFDRRYSLIRSNLSQTPVYGLTAGAFQIHKVRVHDPRSSGVSQLTFNGAQPLALQDQGSFYETPEFVVAQSGSGINWSVPYQLQLLSGNVTEVRYNPALLLAIAPDIEDLPVHQRKLAEQILATVEQMEAENWAGAANDDGAFGKEVHRRVSQQLAAQDARWLGDLYVKTDTREIVSIGQLPPGGVAGTRQVDLIYLKQGQQLAVGDAFDPNKIDDLGEIKTSIGGRISAAQRDALKELMGGRDIVVTAGTPRKWLPGRGWHSNSKFRNILRLLGVLGAASAVYSVLHASQHDDEFQAIDDRITLIKQRNYEQRPDGENEKLLDSIEVQGMIANYMRNFTPDDTAVDIIQLTSMYAMIHDWATN